MAKIADKYFGVDPWAIIEEGFEPSHGRVAESIFSLGNEYMGVRGYFDEGYSGVKNVGSYFNGLYEESEIKHPAEYKGFVKTDRFLTNSVDWLYTRIFLDGEQLDLAVSKISGFKRILDLKTGALVRQFTWHTMSGKKLKLTFERFLSMQVPNMGFQRISFEAVNFSGNINVSTGLDFSPHVEFFSESSFTCIRNDKAGNIFAALGKTRKSGMYLFSSFKLDVSPSLLSRQVQDVKYYGTEFALELKESTVTSFTKTSVNYAGKKGMIDPDEVWTNGLNIAKKYSEATFKNSLADNISYWNNIWNKLDITVDGDEENQQGIRFCIFQLNQTYHGADPSLNIGAKGLSGEAYGGKAFWDTEAYCLQFYLFNNPKAARNLLMYRYKLLPQAIERAKQLDCKGACYPISSIDGEESCGAWQHSSLQIHVSGTIAFGIEHYANICGDKEFLYNEGIEMLVEICRFYASRMQQNPITKEYGFYGVMGVDEFHMMVNNNCFVNYLSKKAMEFTLNVISEMRAAAPLKLKEIEKRTRFTSAELEEWKTMAENTTLPQDPASGIYEQHDGYFTLPYIDVNSIPVTDFPLYNNWSYDRIYRTSMIKQADVLMMLFLYSQDFSKEIKKVNYEYYEPRCIHESSLSPSVHSIIASEIGKHEEAYKFFRFATRLDLDDYNRNTYEGLHTTSIAAAWLNIVYGFGGMRSDREKLLFNPSIPKVWDSYSFRILYKESILIVSVNKTSVTFKVDGSSELNIKVYGKDYKINNTGLTLNIPSEFSSEKSQCFCLIAGNKSMTFQD